MNNYNDISFAVENNLCSSCGACYAVCKNNAINFYETTGGNMFPGIDKIKCTGCGSCYKVCPGVGLKKQNKENLHEDPFVGNIISCFKGRALDENIYKNSQSGGVSTALLKYLFDYERIDYAIVAHMKEGLPPRGDVGIVRDKKELLNSQKSKYTPIPLLKALKKVENMKGNIAVTGLPCHIQGLCNILNTYPEFFKGKIFKIGLICERIMTTAAIDFIVRRAGSDMINNIIFKDKTKPSYPGNIVLFKKEGGEIVLNAGLRMSIKNFFTPARCRLCFDKLNIFSDVVLGDPWGIDDVDRINGETLILTRSEAGRDIIQKAELSGGIKLCKIDKERALKGQAIDKKRFDWLNYIKAWIKLGKTAPDYSFYFEPAANIGKYKRNLLQSFNLDKFCSREDVLNSAGTWLFKQRVQRIMFSPLRKCRRLLLLIRKKFL